MCDRGGLYVDGERYGVRTTESSNGEAEPVDEVFIYDGRGAPRVGKCEDGVGTNADGQFGAGKVRALFVRP
jgi:hypothetical protein